MLAALAGIFVLGQEAVKELPVGALDLSGGVSLEGKAVKLEVGDKKAKVLIFLAHDCPVANRYAPEIRRIVKEYSAKGVGFTRVYLRSLEEVDEVKEHGKEYGYAFDVVLDPELNLVKKTGVRVTPEVVLIGKDGGMKYRGRIDDVNIEHGKVREGYRRDLRVALDEVLAGKSVTMPSTAAVGCFIEGIDR